MGWNNPSTMGLGPQAGNSGGGFNPSTIGAGYERYTGTGRPTGQSFEHPRGSGNWFVPQGSQNPQAGVPNTGSGGFQDVPGEPQPANPNTPRIQQPSPQNPPNWGQSAGAQTGGGTPWGQGGGAQPPSDPGAGFPGGSNAYNPGNPATSMPGQGGGWGTPGLPTTPPQANGLGFSQLHPPGLPQPPNYQFNPGLHSGTPAPPMGQPNRGGGYKRPPLPGMPRPNTGTTIGFSPGPSNFSGSAFTGYGT